MTDTFAPDDGNAELWYQIFADGHPDLKKQHTFHSKLPQDPRCRLCLVPFRGIGGWYMRLRGKKPSSRNPHYCNACDGFLDAFPGGAEVNMSVLYVDIRNSVPTAEALPPVDVSRRINAFLDRTTRVITDNDGFIMAFYGDCVVAVWPPGFVGSGHAAKALATAKQVVARGALRDHLGQEIPVGAAVHSGPVQISTVTAGKGQFRDVSIFGHNVNVTARLAGAAGAGEALASIDTVTAAGETTGNRRKYDLKGVTETIEAVALG